VWTVLIGLGGGRC
jgi:hypothetical protein